MVARSFVFLLCFLPSERGVPGVRVPGMHTVESRNYEMSRCRCDLVYQVIRIIMVSSSTSAAAARSRDSSASSGCETCFYFQAGREYNPGGMGGGGGMGRTRLLLALGNLTIDHTSLSKPSTGGKGGGGGRWDTD